jgi:hypothetical protein
MLGHLKLKNAEEIARMDVSRMWGKISFLRFPNPGSRRPQFAIRFDIMGPAGLTKPESTGVYKPKFEEQPEEASG